MVTKSPSHLDTLCYVLWYGTITT